MSDTPNLQPHMVLWTETLPEMQRPTLLIEFVGIPDEADSWSFDYKEMMEAQRSAALAGWGKAMEALSDLTMLCRGDAVVIMESLGIQAHSEGSTT